MNSKTVIVVGAGPAGTRCAETLVAAGLRPIVIDEGRRSGGQIYRRQPEGFSRSYEKLYGTESAKALDLHHAFDRLRERIDYRPETLAWNVTPEELFVSHQGVSTALAYDALVLCPGATDRLLPVQGWHRAGTYSLGGAQVALKSQACAIGKRVAFVGTGPLLYLVAAQYIEAGASVAAVLDTSPAMRRVLALPKLLVRPGVLWNGMRLVARILRAGVPIHSGVRPLEIAGSPDDGVAAITFADAGGREHTVACDSVAMGWHLRPEMQLAELAGCPVEFDTQTRQWLPRCEEVGRTEVRGLYLAGDGRSILGADAAEIAGRLAGLAVLRDLGLASDGSREAGLRAQLRGLRRFADGLQVAFPWPAHLVPALRDDTILCRCEAITVGEARAAVQKKNAAEANRAKALTRVGMGRCQGRFCGSAAAEVIADAGGWPIAASGRLRAAAPVKPIPISTVTNDA